MPIEGRALANSTSIAYVKSQVIKASPGTLYKLTGYNSKGSAQWIQLHDAASVPADNAVPVAIFTVAATANFEINFNNIGRYFSTGIVVCNSSTGPTKTVGSDDCWFDAQYT